jgi:hypothetical protein
MLSLQFSPRITLVISARGVALSIYALHLLGLF